MPTEWLGPSFVSAEKGFRRVGFKEVYDKGQNFVNLIVAVLSPLLVEYSFEPQLI